MITDIYGQPIPEDMLPAGYEMRTTDYESGTQVPYFNGNPLAIQNGQLSSVSYNGEDATFTPLSQPMFGRGTPVQYQGQTYYSAGDYAPYWDVQSDQDGNPTGGSYQYGLNLLHEQPGWTRALLSNTPIEYRDGRAYVPDGAQMFNESPKVQGGFFSDGLFGAFNNLMGMAPQLLATSMITGGLGAGIGGATGLNGTLSKMAANTMMSGATGGDMKGALSNSLLSTGINQGANMFDWDGMFSSMDQGVYDNFGDMFGEAYDPSIQQMLDANYFLDNNGSGWNASELDPYGAMGDTFGQGTTPSWGMGTGVGGGGFATELDPYGVPAPTSSGGLGGWGDLAKSIGGLLTGQTGGRIIGGLGEMWAKNQQAKSLENLMNRAIDTSDPFASQRGLYQAMLPGTIANQSNALGDMRQRIGEVNNNFGNQLNQFREGFGGEYDSFKNDLSRLMADKYGAFRGEYDDYKKQFNNEYNRFNATADRMYNDPTYWQNDSVLAGLNKMAVNDTERSMASRGFNMSGNEMHAISDRLQNQMGTYVPQIQSNYTNLMNSSLGNLNQAGLGRLNALNQNNQNELSAFTSGRGRALDSFGTAGIASLNAANQNNQNYLGSLFNNVQGNQALSSQIGGLAGGGFGPGYAGQAAAQLGQASTNALNQKYGALGTVFNNVWK